MHTVDRKVVPAEEEGNAAEEEHFVDDDVAEATAKNAPKDRTDPNLCALQAVKGKGKKVESLWHLTMFIIFQAVQSTGDTLRSFVERAPICKGKKCTLLGTAGFVKCLSWVEYDILCLSISFMWMHVTKLYCCK